jgi:ERCC4-type nuclease
MTKLPYFVGSLHIGDYAFFSGNLLCPILVERKSIEDVAISIHDGRWITQKQRMYHGQFVFGYDNSRIAFIIEGKEEKQQVTGGFIGHRKYNVNRERLDEEIENLKSEGFEVLRTT